jgi:integrase
LRGDEIDRSGPVWEYRPASHKSDHRGDGGEASDRVVFLGPQAQAALAPFVAGAGGGYLFSPRRAQRARVRERGLAGPGAPRGERYSVGGYRQEVRRGCDRAGVPRWVPLQLRHAAGTEIRRLFGLERAQAVLGHRELGVTQVYAEVDREAARAVMAEVG